VSSEHT